MNIEEFFKGGMVGLLHTIFGHPLDTLKTLAQNRRDLNGVNGVNGVKPSLRSLYSGVRFPLYLNIFYNSGAFGIYTSLVNTNMLNDSTFTAGFISGGIMSVFLNPFEYYKVREQMIGNSRVNVSVHHSLDTLEKNTKRDKKNRKELNGKEMSWKELNRNKIIIKKMYYEGMTGIKYTFLRESFACGIYFKTYETCKQWELSPFLSGGLAGCNSWLLTYPIDTLKTRYQLDQSKTFVKMIMRGGLWNGLHFCLLRAFLVNGISFTCYEMF